MWNAITLFARDSGKTTKTTTCINQAIQKDQNLARATTIQVFYRRNPSPFPHSLPPYVSQLASFETHTISPCNKDKCASESVPATFISTSRLESHEDNQHKHTHSRTHTYAKRSSIASPIQTRTPCCSLVAPWLAHFLKGPSAPGAVLCSYQLRTQWIPGMNNNEVIHSEHFTYYR